MMDTTAASAAPPAMAPHFHRKVCTARCRRSSVSSVAFVIQTSKRQSQQAERKARAHRLIQQGVLFDLASLEHRSRGELLGLLLAAAKTDDPQRWVHWKEVGDALLAEKSEAVE